MVSLLQIPKRSTSLGLSLIRRSVWGLYAQTNVMGNPKYKYYYSELTAVSAGIVLGRVIVSGEGYETQANPPVASTSTASRVREKGILPSDWIGQNGKLLIILHRAVEMKTALGPPP
eukprot:450458-Prorocentrum_minimum.AAC.3